MDEPQIESERRDDEQEMHKHISERFSFVWEQHLKIVDLGITLITGTIILLINGALQEKVITRIESQAACAKYLVVAAIVSLLVALISAISCRIYSQVLMEWDVLGPKERLRKYLDESDVKPTRGFEGLTYHFLGEFKTSWIWIWKLTQYATAFFAASGIGLTVIVFAIVFLSHKV